MRLFALHAVLSAYYFFSYPLVHTIGVPVVRRWVLRKRDIVKSFRCQPCVPPSWGSADIMPAVPKAIVLGRRASVRAVRSPHTGLLRCVAISYIVGLGVLWQGVGVIWIHSIGTILAAEQAKESPALFPGALDVVIRGTRPEPALFSVMPNNPPLCKNGK